jgi:hypothetical protein
MGKRGRPPKLDNDKQHDILMLVSSGCTRRTAAQFVGCAHSTIHYTAAHNQEFAKKLEKAESHAIVSHLKNINQAAKFPPYWRASAWALERLRPDDYALHKPDVITAKQMSQILACLSQMIVDEVPIAAFRKNIIKKIIEFNKMIGGINPDKSENTSNNPLVNLVINDGQKNDIHESVPSNVPNISGNP